MSESSLCSKYFTRALEETQQLEVEKALVLTNQGSVMWRQEKANKFTRGQVVSEDLSQNVVAVCGVVLPRIVPRQTEQVCTRQPIKYSNLSGSFLVLMLISLCRGTQKIWCWWTPPAVIWEDWHWLWLPRSQCCLRVLLDVAKLPWLSLWRLSQDIQKLRRSWRSSWEIKLTARWVWIWKQSELKVALKQFYTCPPTYNGRGNTGHVLNNTQPYYRVALWEL